MRYKCALCEISPGTTAYDGSREEVTEHIEEHGSTDIDLWLTEATEQATLGESV